MNNYLPFEVLTFHIFITFSLADVPSLHLLNGVVWLQNWLHVFITHYKSKVEA